MRTFQCTGRIGKDAEKMSFESGNSVIEFNLAENFHFKNNAGEKIDSVEWHECRLWRNNGNDKIAEYLKKGTLISVSGNVRYHTFKNKEGQHVKKAYILVDEVNFY